MSQLRLPEHLEGGWGGGDIVVYIYSNDNKKTNLIETYVKEHRMST